MKPSLVNASDNEGKKERENERGVKEILSNWLWMKFEKWGIGIMIMIHWSCLKGWLLYRATRCTIVM